MQAIRDVDRGLALLEKLEHLARSHGGYHEHSPSFAHGAPVTGLVDVVTPLRVLPPAGCGGGRRRVEHLHYDNQHYDNQQFGDHPFDDHRFEDHIDRTYPYQDLCPFQDLHYQPDHQYEQQYHMQLPTTKYYHPQVQEQQNRTQQPTQDQQDEPEPNHQPSHVSPSCDRRKQLQDVARVGPLRAGSALWDMVSGELLCGRDHVMGPRTVAAMRREGITATNCDWCSRQVVLDPACITSWSDLLHAEAKTMREKRPRDLGAVMAAVDRVYYQENVLQAPRAEDEKWWHCAHCRTDLCSDCFAEIRHGDQYQVPCLCCSRCGVHVRLADATTHVCKQRGQGANTPPPPPPSDAVAGGCPSSSAIAAFMQDSPQHSGSASAIRSPLPPGSQCASFPLRVPSTVVVDGIDDERYASTWMPPIACLSPPRIDMEGTEGWPAPSMPPCSANASPTQRGPSFTSELIRRGGHGVRAPPSDGMVRADGHTYMSTGCQAAIAAFNHMQDSPQQARSPLPPGSQSASFPLRVPSTAAIDGSDDERYAGKCAPLPAFPSPPRNVPAEGRSADASPKRRGPALAFELCLYGFAAAVMPDDVLELVGAERIDGRVSAVITGLPPMASVRFERREDAEATLKKLRAARAAGTMRYRVSKRVTKRR